MPMGFIPTIKPSWPNIPNVHAFTTTCDGGISAGEYASLNLGDHVGDRLDDVLQNRERVGQYIAQLDPRAVSPTWLTQVHGVQVSRVDAPAPEITADSAVSKSPHHVCVVMTADCLPILIAAKDGSEVAAVHAGWKGLANGVIESTLSELGSDDLQIWLGPCISKESFEVGPELREVFVLDADNPLCFSKGKADRWHASLAELATRRLQRLGITEIYGGDYCTYRDSRFFSHRQASHLGRSTGRIATAIWCAS